jgi:hypothetical protein
VLLAFAIPLQGMAAVTAGQCMAFGHHQDGAGHESHGHAQDDADGHDHAAHSHGSGGAQQGDDDGTKHCGPCTACCASASIAGSTGLTLPFSPSHPKYVFSQLPPLGIQPDGLDRPPLAL